MTDLDRLLDEANRADAATGRHDHPMVVAPSEIRRLIERVKEAERELKVATTKLEKTGAQLKAAEEVNQDWRLHFGPAAQRRIESLETRLRAAEEVAERARRFAKAPQYRENHIQLHEALRHYDEAVGRVKE